MADFQEKPTILVVDDVADNISLLSSILSGEYKVKASNNGKSAVAIARKSPPDLILLDVMMPELDGYEVCRQLKDDPRTKNIPVIFVTALGEAREEQLGFEIGAVDYITKPVSPPIVLARVKTHLVLYEQNRILEKKVAERTEELRSSRFEIIRRLGLAAEYRDNETGLHVLRIGYLARFIAEAIGIEEKEADIILNAAPMHDVGKIGIPDSILLKPGRLTESERQIMEKHAEFGAQIIGEHQDPLLKAASSAALTHHEKWDGTGYPARLQKEEIPLIGRITAIVDVFDALTSARPYKEAWSLDRALELISNESGRHFDPDLVPAFIDNIDGIMEIKEQNSDSNYNPEDPQPFSGE